VTLPVHEAPKHIIACTILKRMRDFLEIARFLERRNSELRVERRLRFYLDEFDEYIDIMRGIVEELVMLKCVEKIVIVTGTAARIWGNRLGWESLFVLNPRIGTDDESYLMFKDCKHIDNASLDAVEIVPIKELMPTVDKGSIPLLTLHRRIIAQYPDILTPGRVLFVPGCVSRVSHEDVAHFWNKFGCSSFVFNGSRTIDGFYGKLYLTDRTVIDVPHMKLHELESEAMKTYIQKANLNPLNPAQLNDIIADLIILHNLLSTPIAITGLMCIERAQSIVHPVWGTFTDAIFHNAASPEKAYQLQRQLGHIKKWSTYRGIPRVFTYATFREDVKILESRADAFGRRFGGTRATLTDYVASGKEGCLTSHEKKEKKSENRKLVVSTIVQHPTPFKTIKEANAFIKEKTGKRGIQKLTERNGYILSSRLLSIYKKKTEEDLSEDDRLTVAKYERIGIGQNISANTGQSYMVYPVYPTMESPPSDVMYYVRYLPAQTPVENTITHV
jgi:hypothetical protein